MSAQTRIAAAIMAKDKTRGQGRAKPVSVEPPRQDVPLQVMVSAPIRRQLALLCAERGESMRTIVLRGLRTLGVEIDEAELVDRRGRRRD